jgi:ketosteroid isomerase-like protein
MEEELAVAEANERFYRALENNDLAAMEALWLHEDWVKCVHPGWELLAGWEQVRESWERIFNGATGMRVGATEVKIKLAGDFAWVSCTETLAIFLDCRSAPTSATTTATNLFYRERGQWRMALHHASQTPSSALNDDDDDDDELFSEDD